MINLGSEEAWELFKAWVLVTLAFFILLGEPFSAAGFGLVAVAVGGAVVFHELGHKYVAERYGHVARFVANNAMLIIGVLMAFTGFIFIAPGAVHVRGLHDARQNALVAWAGPAVNAALAFAAYMMTGFGVAQGYFALILRVNALLGAFNMLPVPGFDGEKIWAGSKTLYGGTVVVLGFLVAAGFVAV
jgi:Zn-dependent protease